MKQVMYYDNIKVLCEPVFHDHGIQAKLRHFVLCRRCVRIVHWYIVLAQPINIEQRRKKEREKDQTGQE